MSPAFAYLVLSLGLVAAEPTTPNGVDQAIAKATAITELEIRPRVPGFAVAVAVHGNLMWSEGFGYADLTEKTPVSPATRFRIGSTTKTLTAAGLALLVERGLIDLDAPIQKYIADFPDKGSTLTLRLFAGHLSGVRNYRGKEAYLNRPFVDLRSGLKIFEDDPLISTPGEKFSYSSYNWNVIGVAMERVANQGFLKYMDENVFIRLGMDHTRPDRAGVIDSARATFYELSLAKGFIATPPVDSSYKWPSGGYLSTAEDLVRFGSALLQPGLLKSESLHLLFTSQKTTAGKLTHYGVGWFVQPTFLYHGGDSVGGTSVILLLPSANTVVAIVSNRGHLILKDASDPTSAEKPAPFSSQILVRTAHQLAEIFALLDSTNAAKRP